MSPIENIDDVHHFLDHIPSFKTQGKSSADFSLDRFRRFCAALGNPQQQFPSIHIAGSNGKGSTCQIIAAIYKAADYQVGVFTSPHLLQYNERFAINGQLIDDDALISFFHDYQSLISSFRLTYFEISTAVAFWWFARRQVDVAVLETGLGGRLDATNIIKPLASVITTITLDHTDILGDTIEEIAAEKAGIIKKNRPVILGNVPEKGKKVISKKAKQQDAPLFESEGLKPRQHAGVYYVTDNGREISLQSNLQTPVQAYNIAASWMVTSILKDPLPVTDRQLREGIKNVPINARFERLHPTLPWYFDGAHNLQAVQAMIQMIRRKQPVEETILVFSLMKDKIRKKMLLSFSEFKKKIYYTLPQRRAADVKDIQKQLADVKSFPTTKSSRLELFKELESELVIFAGSFYFYPTVREWVSSYKID